MCAVWEVEKKRHRAKKYTFLSTDITILRCRSKMIKVTIKRV